MFYSSIEADNLIPFYVIVIITIFVDKFANELIKHLIVSLIIFLVLFLCLVKRKDDTQVTPRNLH